MLHTMHLSKYNETTERVRGEPYHSGRSSMQLSLPMLRNRESTLENEIESRGKFITIDDAIDLANKLLEDLTRLGEYRYPLSVRKGVSNITPEEKKESETVKAGARTYFFDIQKTKADKPYLTISESRFMGEGKDRERNTITVFPEQIEAFAKTLYRMAKKVQ